MKRHPPPSDASPTSSVAWRVANPAGLARMRGLVATWLSELGADEEAVRGIVLACSEAASDALVGSPPGTPVDVAADWIEGHVVVRVAGRAGRRRHGRTGRHRPDPFGKQLVAASFDHVIVVRSVGGRRYLMCRCLQPRCERAGAAAD